MSFADPYLLLYAWGALVLLLASWWGINRRRRLLADYAAGEGLTRLRGPVSNGRRYLRASLAAAAFVFMIIALAGPRYGYHWEKVERRGVDIMLALDCSRSMLAADVEPSRLVRAKREIVDLLDMLTGDRVGLVAFAGEAFLQCPLTLDYGAFHIFLEALSPDFLPRGGTNLGAAVNTSISGFEPESAADKAVILITDGESTTGPDAVEAARQAAEQDIRLFTIGVGADQGAPVPGKEGSFAKDSSGRIVISRLDEATLKEMAAVSGGIYVRSVAGDMDLDAIYRDHIQAKMEKTTLESGRRRVWENRFQWFAALALLCLAAERLVPLRRAVLLLLAAALVLPAATPVRADNLYDDVRQGRTAYEQGRFEKALKYFIDAQLRDPDNPALLYNIGDAYYQKGEYEESARHFEEALESAEKDSPLRRDLLYNLGNTRFRQQEFKKAIERYAQALEMDPDDRQARENRELAEKALERQQEQQKQPPTQGAGSPGKDKGQQQQKNQGDKTGQQKTGSGEEPPPASEGQPRPQPEKEDGSAGQQPTGEQSQQSRPSDRTEDGSPPAPEAKPSADAAGQPASAAQEQAGPGGDSPAASIGADRLNRLEDKPGAAMIPAYNGREVEKDW